MKYLEYTYTKKMIVNLNFELIWVSYIFTGKLT